MLTDATALPLIAPATRNKLMHKPTHIHTHTHASQCAAGGALVWARAQTLEWVYGWMDGWQFYCEFAQLTKNFFMANKCFAFSPFFCCLFLPFFAFKLLFLIFVFACFFLVRLYLAIICKHSTRSLCIRVFMCVSRGWVCVCVWRTHSPDAWLVRKMKMVQKKRRQIKTRI